MNYIILGNILAFIGSVLMMYSGALLKRSKILIVQSVQILMFILSNIVLGGISGVIINSLSFVRNILSYFEKLDIKWKTILSLASIFLTIHLNNKGVIGYLPLISMLLYVWYINVKDVVKFKTLIIVTTVLWIIYDFYIMSYTSCLFDIICVTLNIITIIKIKKEETINHG